MKITLIVAMNGQGLIGKGGTIPWRRPADLKRFKEVTQGSVLVMGRKTVESLPFPLKNRTVFGVTSDPESKEAGEGKKCQRWFSSVYAALMAATEVAGENGTIYVAGGRDIYQAVLSTSPPVPHFLDITRVPDEFPEEEGNDVFMPFIPWHLYQEASDQPNPSDPEIRHTLWYRK